MTKIVINRCFGGFDLSDEAYEKVAIRKGWTRCIHSQYGYAFWMTKDNHAVHAYDLDRNDQDLVIVVESMGERSWGDHSELMVVDIPNDVKWQIKSYDGLEHVAEVHRTWPTSDE